MGFKRKKAVTTLDDWRKRRPVNRDRIDCIKAAMELEAAQYRLAELREDGRIHPDGSW
jgi:hypothetical protein